MDVLLGAVADDFTGAADLANTFARSGLRVVLIIGVPRTEIALRDIDAVIVALKSRTQTAEAAVAASRAALQWLRRLGARQFFFKYCSTFDSTPNGNIGPVADAMLDDLEADFTVVCPAFPANDRTVYQGHLFVGSQLLSESYMKDHPLTPMNESDLVRLMGEQSKYGVGLVAHDIVLAGTEATTKAFELLRSAGTRYAVVDALTNHDLTTIGAAAASHRLITGGSGAALGLAENFRHEGLLGGSYQALMPAAEGPGAVLAGSCSQATRAQIECWRRSYPHFKLDVSLIAAGESVVDDALAWANENAAQPILIYSSDEPSEVSAIQKRYGRERVAALIEDAIACIATGLVELGTRRFIIAGGETSGAVVSALDITGLRVGPEIEPGVPWMQTLNEPRLTLALKSGNFGGREFFCKALAMLQ